MINAGFDTSKKGLRHFKNVSSAAIEMLIDGGWLRTSPRIVSVKHRLHMTGT